MFLLGDLRAGGGSGAAGRPAGTPLELGRARSEKPQGGRIVLIHDSIANRQPPIDNVAL